MKTNKAVLAAVALTLSVASSVSFGAVRQYGCSQAKPENVQQAVSASMASTDGRAPAQAQTTMLSIGEKLKQARQSHHVTPQNIDCAFDALID